MKSNISKPVRIGSRDSKLAIRQAQIVMEMLHQAEPELTLELVTMKTTGDRILDQRLDQAGGKGLFVKELDQALRDGRIDLSVHSLKDMPMELPEDLPLFACTSREDPRDILICAPGTDENQLKQGGIIGTASPRRIVQLRRLYPACRFRTIRGNVGTRLRKLEEEDYDATVLAAAGLSRLSLQSIIDRYFTLQEMIPAAGQGIIAVQGRLGDPIEALVRGIDNPESRIAACCERAFVQALGGSCASPVAAYAAIRKNKLHLTGLYAESEESEARIGEIEGPAAEASSLARALAAQLEGAER